MDVTMRSQIIQVGKHRVAEVLHVGCNNGENFCEHTGRGGDTEGEDPELIMGVSHCKMEKFPVAMRGISTSPWGG